MQDVDPFFLHILLSYSLVIKRRGITAVSPLHTLIETSSREQVIQDETLQRALHGPDGPDERKGKEVRKDRVVDHGDMCNWQYVVWL